MAKTRDTQNQDPRNGGLPGVVADIITRDRSAFFNGYHGQFLYDVTRVFATKFIRELNGGILDIPQDIVTADVAITRQEDGHQHLRTRSFMKLGSRLVPLSTHAIDHSVSKVYRLDADNARVASTEPLSDHVLDTLPKEVTLMRVLSRDEAGKFASGDTSLGSSHPLYWKNKIHTSLHNVTNEFEGSGDYAQLVGVVLPRETLRGLVAAGAATIATYDFLFKDRDPLSPLPYETEVVIDTSAMPHVLAGYSEWATRVGVPFKNSPFSQTH